MRLIGLFFLLGSSALAWAQAVPTGPSSADSASADFVLPLGGDIRYGDVRVARERTSITRVFQSGVTYDVGQVTAFRSDSVLYRMHSRAVPQNGTVGAERFLLRRTVAGPIDLYVRASDPRPSPDDASFEFFSVGDGPVQRASDANLRVLLKEDPASLRYLRESSAWRRAQYGVMAGGLALLSYGLYRSFSNVEERSGPDPPSYTFRLHAALPLGVGLSLFSLVPRARKHQAWHRAVLAYGSQ